MTTRVKNEGMKMRILCRVSVTMRLCVIKLDTTQKEKKNINKIMQKI